jgi:protein-S-isoprenylcysteine O-methyltransferase Ste14
MLKLISSIGLAVALADLKRRIRHWVRSGILGAVGALFAVIALCFFLVAAHLFLSGLLSPIASALIIGGVLLVIALILLFLASRPFAGRSPISSQPQPLAGEGTSENWTQSAAVDAVLRHPLFPAAATALVAGFFLGRRSKREKD